MRLLLILACTACASAAQLQPTEILNNVAAAYSRGGDVRIVAELTSELIGAGGSILSVDAEYTYLAKATNRYRIVRRTRGSEVMAASDGSSKWIADRKTKQWAHGTAEDFLTSSTNLLAMRYVGLAKPSSAPVLQKDAIYKLGKTKIPCHVLRVQQADSTHELWIDKERFFVLRHEELTPTRVNDKPAKIRTIVTVKEIAMVGPIQDAVIAFTNENGWTYVESLRVPPEEQIPAMGRRAPNFKVATLAGSPVELGEKGASWLS